MPFYKGTFNSFLDLVFFYVTYPESDIRLNFPRYIHRTTTGVEAEFLKEDGILAGQN